MFSGEFESFADRRFNIVAVGRTGEGKSAVLNSILRYCGQTTSNFEERAGVHSVTKKIQEQSARLPHDGSVVRLIDTVGFFDTVTTTDTTRNKKLGIIEQAAATLEDDQKIVLNELLKIIQLCNNGIHAFLIVVAVGRLTKEIKDTFQLIINYFGTHLFEYCIFVFTKIDKEPDLSKVEMCGGIEQCLDSMGYPHSIRDQCVFINNREANQSKIQEAMQTLFSAINNNIQRNGNRPYLNIFFDEAQKQMKQERARILAEVKGQFQQKLENEMKPMKEQHLKEVNSMQDKMEEELAQIKGNNKKAQDKIQHQFANQIQEAQQKHEEAVNKLKTEQEAAAKENKELNEIEKKFMLDKMEEAKKKVEAVESQYNNELQKIRNETKKAEEKAEREVQFQYNNEWAEKMESDYENQMKKMKAKMMDKAGKDYQDKLMAMEKSIADSNERNRQLQGQLVIRHNIILKIKDDAMQKMRISNEPTYESAGGGAIFHAVNAIGAFFQGRYF